MLWRFLLVFRPRDGAVTWYCPLAPRCKPRVPIHVSLVNKCIVHPQWVHGAKRQSVPSQPFGARGDRMSP